jgi:mono/diheme cytochrome c family protein
VGNRNVNACLCSHIDSLRRALVVVVSVILLSSSYAGLAASERSGAEIYHDYCSVCHGDHGNGDSRARASMIPPPRDFTTTDAAADLTRERMLAAVRVGRPGTAMAGWMTQLTETEIVAVVRYIQEQLMMPIASEDAELGRRTYANTCSVCHGDDGRGARWTISNLNPSPRNFTLPEARADLNRQQMVHVARYGKPDTAMPGFESQLSSEEIEAVVDYIRSAFFPPEMEGAGAELVSSESSSDRPRLGPGEDSVNMEAAMPRGLIGDSNRGHSLYMTNCTACHGVEGDGQGPRAYFILPKPRNFRHPGSKQTYNRPALFRAIALGSRGAEMPAWDKVFDDQQIADVAEFVFHSYIRGDSALSAVEDRAEATSSQ